jgi:hypothetical protein
MIGLLTCSQGFWFKLFAQAVVFNLELKVVQEVSDRVVVVTLLD